MLLVEHEAGAVYEIDRDIFEKVSWHFLFYFQKKYHKEQMAFILPGKEAVNSKQLC